IASDSSFGAVLVGEFRCASAYPASFRGRSRRADPGAWRCLRTGRRRGWSDPDARKTLQVIERRQRNRAAAAQSKYGSLEGAISAAEHGIDHALVQEIAHLSGIKPTTASQIFSDPGGEAVGVYAKAVGLRRQGLITLWRALRRPHGDS